jgi:uncharacterized delta-60 repeat protein
MTTYNTTFTGFSGNIFDLSTLTGRTKSFPKTVSNNTTEPVVINKTPKNGPSRTPSSGPVYKTGGTQTQSVSSRRSVSTPQGLNLPFTAGTVDYSFPAGGGYEVDGFDGAIYHIIVDANGKYLLGGSFGYYYYNEDYYYSPYLIRLNSDGSVDESFNITNNWDCFGGGFNGTVYTLELQSDGKILVGGSFTYYDNGGNCYNYNRIIRLNDDATRDLSFNVGYGFDSDVYDIHIQPDGKILVGGDFTVYNGVSAYKLIRLNSNGSVDSSFSIGNFDSYVNVIELQSDGKILVGGYFTSYSSITQNYITRLNTDGTLDTTFQIGVGFNDEVYTIALQSDGKIIVGGYFDTFDNNQLYGGHIIRLATNGSIDTLFGYGTDGPVHSLAIQSDGKILVGGYISDFYPNNYSTINIGKLVRFNSDCSYDDSYYNSYNVLFSDGVEYITVLEDNNILVGGFFNNNGADPSIYPLNYFGRLNNSISVYPYTYTVQACVQPLIDETITYVVGSMTPLTGDYTYSFQSLQNPSVTVCGYIIPEYPSNIIDYVMVNTYADCEEAYKSNYKAIILEECLNYSFGFPPFWIVDNKFEIGDIFYNDSVIDLMGSTFFKYAATIVDVIPWSAYTGDFGPVWYYLTPVNYSPYSSCDEAIEANGLIYGADSCSEMEETYPLIHKAIYGPTVLPIPTGNNPVKVLFNYYPYGPYEYISGGTPEVYSFINLGDYTNDYNDLCELGLTKIAPEGLLNYNFQNTGFDGSFVNVTLEQPDGKILVGGEFNQYLEVNVGNFMRINPDGSLDETFYLGEFNSGVKTIALQPDGKILVGGNFTDYNGEYAGRIIRLNSDGTIDQDFTYSTEFNGTVNTIALQRDGKILVGGQFNYYYDFHCEQIVRLNSDGSPDFTFEMGDGFDGDRVYTITTEIIRDRPFYTGGAVTYTENIIVGGQFTYYKGTNNIGGIVKLSPTGDILPDFGNGFNRDTGSTPRVNNVVKQPDGKLIVVGGGYGHDLKDYNETWIPQNIVRLVKDVDGMYQIDQTFTTHNWDGDNYSGGFGGAAFALTLLPNGKIMVGGFFSYYGDNITGHSTSHLVRLNSDGTLDAIFTFQINAVTYTAELLTSGRLLVGGRFSSPMDKMLELFIGEEYELRSFTTCDGLNSNIFLPTTTNSGFAATPITYESISTDGLDLVYNGDDDDDNFVITLPTPFDVNFLGVNYTSINVSTNPYITFGDGGNPSNCCFDIPNEIPSEVGLPGVFVSFQCDSPHSPGDYDSDMLELYTGLTDGGNTLIIKYFGRDHCEEIKLLNYTYKFYKDNSNYFDLYIDDNTLFFNGDPTGGVSNGVDPTWITTFNSSGGNAYRIGNVVNTIKADVNERPAVCGTVGSTITKPNINSNFGIGGSMYFDGVNDTMVQINNDGGQFGFNGLNDFTIEWFQYYEGGVNSRPFSIGVYNNPSEMIGMSFEGTVYLWIANGGYDTTIVNEDLLNGWHHIAITRYYDGNNHIWRVFLDGVQKTSFADNTDTSNTYTLTLGNQLNNDGRFQGYITNFRVNNLSALYTSDFTIPSQPLTCDSNIILTMDATDEAGLLYDSCESQSISSTGVTWSNETPFVNLNDFSLFTATDSTSYVSCVDCGQLYQSTLYVENSITNSNVRRVSLTKEDINNIQNFGPFFTTTMSNIPTPEVFNLLSYHL